MKMRDKDPYSFCDLAKMEAIVESFLKETKDVADPIIKTYRKEIEKLKKEVKSLKSKNKKLRDRNKKLVKEVKEYEEYYDRFDILDLENE